MEMLERLLWIVEARLLAVLARLMPDRYGVTVVLTSCGRHDLLDKTLSSFFTFNTFPIKRMIIIEDGDHIAEELAAKYKSREIDWVSTGQRVGQFAAIDYAYSRVETSFIFHMEDDWEFYETGFIEKSMAVLLRNPKCIQLWLRSLEDASYCPIEDKIFTHFDIQWRKVSVDWHTELGVWHGFSFNPGLRRFKDYRLTNGYGSLSEYDFKDPGSSKSTIGEFYRKHEFFAGILSDNEGRGYVRHLGWGLTVKPLKDMP